MASSGSHWSEAFVARFTRLRLMILVLFLFGVTVVIVNGLLRGFECADAGGLFSIGLLGTPILLLILFAKKFVACAKSIRYSTSTLLTAELAIALAIIIFVLLGLVFGNQLIVNICESNFVS